MAARPTAAELAEALRPPAEAPPPPLPEVVASLGAQVERLTLEKANALEEVRA